MNHEKSEEARENLKYNRILKLQITILIWKQNKKKKGSKAPTLDINFDIIMHTPRTCNLITCSFLA